MDKPQTKTYEGIRFASVMTVKVNNRPLCVPNTHRPQNGKWFECGSSCPNSKFLALAILTEHYGNEFEASRRALDFTHTVISKLPVEGGWTLTTESIDEALKLCRDQEFHLELQDLRKLRANESASKVMAGLHRLKSTETNSGLQTSPP